MRCFVSVSDNQSLTKAAREMFITQPAMTAKMNAMESELNERLLERGRHTHLTPMGEMVYKYCSRIISEYDEMLDNIEQAELESHRSVRFGFHGPHDWAGIPQKIARFHQMYPDVDVEVVIDNWQSLLDDLQSGALDLIVIEGSEVEGMGNVVSVPLFEERVCLVVHHDSPLIRKDEVSVSEVVEETLIVPDMEISPRFLHKYYDAMKQVGFKVRHGGRGGNYGAALTLVESGLGFGCVPLSFCRSDSRFKAIPFNDLDVHLNYRLAWARESASAATSQFASFLENEDWPHDSVE